MKTTADIPDSLMREARKLASRQRTTLRALNVEGLRRVLTERRSPADFRLRKATFIHLYDPSKLACIPSLGRAPTLVYVRPSNEALLRARVPGAQD